MTDVLFVNQPSPDHEYVIRDVNRCGRKTPERMIWPQTNLAWEAAVMREAGYAVDLIDCIASRVSWPEIQERISQLRPRYLVANAITTTLENDMRIFEYGKRVNAVTIAQGPHVTSQPVAALKAFPQLDFCIINEAEATLRELVDTIENGTVDLSRVNGIARRVGGDVVCNESRPFIKDLNTLPVPAYDLLPLDKYYMPFFGSYVFIETGRGCPYRCIYCRQTVMWKSKVRNRSAEKIFEEVVALKRAGTDHIMFRNDTFTVDRRMVMSLCDLIIREGIKIRWCCQTHVACVDRELLARMKQAGCWMVAFGFESADQSILDQVRKQATVEQNEQAARLVHEAGMEVWGYFMFGNPGENKDTITRTIDMALDLPVTIASFNVATPFPGTEFYSLAQRNGWIPDAATWSDFDQSGAVVVSYEDLSQGDIARAVKRAYLKFYFRPHQIVRILSEVRDWRTASTLFLIVVSFVKRMMPSTSERSPRQAHAQEQETA